jgi:EAL domain-containing protein (putative c-di-GMP-specific phosphodiesterase class I)
MQAPSTRGQVESQLLAHVKRLERNYFEWRVVHLHLSQLQAHNRRHYQLKLAASEFDGPLRRLKSELFQLSNGDIFFFWHGGTVADIDPVVLRLRYLFSDDPLTRAVETDPDDNAELSYDHEAMQGSGRFCTSHDLDREYDSFRFSIEELLEKLGQSEVEVSAAGNLEPLDPARLARIETSLATMDLSGLLRRQAVCAVLPQSSPKPLFHEVYVAIRELAQLLVPGVDLLGDAWLFQRLAASLDRRLLTCLAKREEGAPAGTISLNLRLATLLSPDFLNFHHEYRQNGSSSVVVELQLIDIFAELGAYMFIREFLRERGYLICIDGLHDLHLPLIDRKQLGADLVKVSWSPDLLDGVNEARREKLRAAIKQAGYDRVILCRCDTPDAISWGQSMGIRLFQGYYLDARLRAARPPAIAAARNAMRGAKAS